MNDYERTNIAKLKLKRRMTFEKKEHNWKKKSNMAKENRNFKI